MDPVTFVEKCEEFLAVHPLSEAELFAVLTSALEGTAKDWWSAERRYISSWPEFKAVFLESFLTEDYEAEVERSLH